MCNVPIKTVNISSLLPRQAESNELIILNLKKKVDYKRHVLLYLVYPSVIVDVLEYLKAHNNLYSDFVIKIQNILELFSYLIRYNC